MMRINDLLRIGLHEVALTGKQMVDLLCEGTGIEQAEVNLKFLEGLATNGDPANYFIRFVDAPAVANTVRWIITEGYTNPTIPMHRAVTKQKAPIVPKLGHNIGQREEDSMPITPQGIYAYPLTQEMYSDIFVTKDQDWGTDMKFLLLFTGHGKFLMLDSSYTENDFAKDIAILEKKYKRVADIISLAKQEHESPAALIWAVTKSIARDVPGSLIVQWMRILWKDLGYSYVYDPGNSIIHSRQPSQAVFFAPQSYKLVQSMENPLVKKVLHKKRQEKLSKFESIKNLNAKGITVKDTVDSLLLLRKNMEEAELHLDEQDLCIKLSKKAIHKFLSNSKNIFSLPSTSVIFSAGLPKSALRFVNTLKSSKETLNLTKLTRNRLSELFYYNFEDTNIQDVIEGLSAFATKNKLK